MDDTDFITILAWMRRLKMSGVEKIVYAIIYGFSKDRRSDFHGSRQYLADWCECSTKTIERALAHLVELRYIVKREEVVNGVKFCRYTVDFNTLDKLSIPWTKCPEGSANLSKTEDKMSHNNIEDNIDNNIENDTRTRVKTDKKFSFKESLINAGATEEHVDKLLEIRKRKGLNNSQKAYTLLIESINTICKMQGVAVDDVVAFMVRPTQNWGAIRPDWGGVEHITAQRSRTRKTMTIGDLINREMTYYDAAN